MTDNQIKNDSITRQEDDFAQWYTDVCKKAELMDYSSTKGFIIYRPYGYAIWENIQAYLDKRFKETGHQNVYMPMVIPESLFNKEKEHVEGFAPETLIASEGGGEKIDDRLIIRPTSETLFCEHYAKILKSYRDLPLLYNQWCSVVRWEKTTRPFLRGSEFLWQEGHTLHETEQEARHEALSILDIYDDLGRDLLAIPFSKGIKTDKEKFAGALETYSLESLNPDGKALQCGTTHYFGTGFAKAFDISYQGRDGKIYNPHQTSWGVSTRLLGSIIMMHGDDNGLVLPPYVAPIQVVIIPVAQNKEGVLNEAKKIEEQLKRADFKVKLDDSDHTAGWKFAEYEMKGVPVRIEIGPRDIEHNVVTAVKRNDGVKLTLSRDTLVDDLTKLLKQIHDEMYKKALDFQVSHTYEVHTFDELKEVMDNNKGYAKAMWCGDPDCEAKIKEVTSATARVLPFNQIPCDDKCVVCGKKADKVVLFAKAY
ncbi:MAG: proline--tRNA ligase [Coprobacillus sp.]|nr:proline--tRNA ligase [Coprobacillus sp.]